ncbi:cation:proton antiporter domain-containing protein [Streptomyces gilvosporeus]|uniref:Cation/H(+) antiporter n=1 Tax=Streptomyces gilvosporeus TaxID=553510 RepID=A0A1V0TN01_9ACTN|nr:cation:proton antiporter [Streptomyces gilvosporeus]ARF54283.1 cation/H(+) antiporter [Streptomyces gilvosporeus]
MLTVTLAASGGAGAVDPMARFLLAVAVIVLLSHLLGVLLGRLGQPLVIGEILGGLLLGPSALGWIWPAGQAWLLPPEVTATLDMAAQLGLVTFMFLLGCELGLEQTEHTGRKALGAAVVGGMGLPFLVGTGIAALAPAMLKGSAPQFAGYVCFFGLAMSITALPVLARLLVDLRMDRSSLGSFSLAAAAVGDGVAWLGLTVLLAVTGTGGTLHIATTVGITLALVALTVFVVRPLLAAVVRKAEQRPGGERLLPLLLVGAIAYAVVTHLLGLHPVIGAFLFGTAVPRDSTVTARMNQQLQGFTLTVLLPLFFAGVGLHVSIGALGLHPGPWLVFAGILVAATLTKIVGAGGAARVAGFPRTDALRFGALMNCRGVTELVVAGIGWQLHLISATGLTVLVLMALITTAVTSPLLKALGPTSTPPAPQPREKHPVAQSAG